MADSVNSKHSKLHEVLRVIPLMKERSLSSRLKNQPDIHHRFVVPFYRNLIRHGIKLIVRNHESGLALSHFQFSNNFRVNVRYQEVIFEGVSYSPLLSGDRVSERNNFMWFAAVIKMIFVESKEADIPIEFQDLIGYLENYTVRRKEIIMNHIALMGTEERINQIICFHWKRVLLDGAVCDQIFSCMKPWMVGDWRERFRPEKWDRMGPIGSIFYHIRKTGVERNFKDSAYVKRCASDCGDPNRTAIRFCRDVGVHMLENCKKGQAVMEDLEIPILYHFWGLLLAFQRSADDVGSLTTLRP